VYYHIQELKLGGIMSQKHNQKVQNTPAYQQGCL